MSQYVEFSLPDGSTVMIESDERGSGIVKAGIGQMAEQARETFEESADKACKAVMIVLDKLRNNLHDSPDGVEITFGLKASGEVGGLVVAKAGIEASYSVKLTWKKNIITNRV